MRAWLHGLLTEHCSAPCCLLQGGSVGRIVGATSAVDAAHFGGPPPSLPHLAAWRSVGSGGVEQCLVRPNLAATNCERPKIAGSPFPQTHNGAIEGKLAGMSRCTRLGLSAPRTVLGFKIHSRSSGHRGMLLQPSHHRGLLIACGHRSPNAST